MAVKEKIRQTTSAAKLKTGSFPEKTPRPSKGYAIKSGLSQTAWKSKKGGPEIESLLELPAAHFSSSIVQSVLARNKTSRGEVELTKLTRGLAGAAEEQLATELVTELESHVETKTDVKALCDRYGLRREELGRLTGFSLRALADWAGGKVPSQPAHRRLHEIRRLLDALAELVEKEAITPWLHQRNPAFGNLTPLQVIETGEMDRLWSMAHERSAGMAD